MTEERPVERVGSRRRRPALSIAVALATVVALIVSVITAPSNQASSEPIVSGPMGRWVQLSRYDVERSVLEAPGVPLAAMLGTAGAASVDTLSGPPPVAGWRIIDGALADNQVVVAAPWTDRGDGAWMLVQAYRNGGEWGTVVETPEQRIRVGRADRRGGLTLNCGGNQLELVAGQSVQLQATLTNSGATTWTTDGQDFDYVIGTLAPEGGPPFPPRRSDGMAHEIHALGPLLPGASIELPMAVDNVQLETLPPGTYMLTAELYDLHLPCPPVSLVVRPAG